MRRWYIALLALVLAWGICGCNAPVGGQEGATLDVYYAARPEDVPGGDILATRQVDWSEQAHLDQHQQARCALELLLAGPEEDGLTAPLPAGTELLDCTVSGGTAVVDFSGAYAQLSGMRLTIAEYCVTLTLTQIEPIRMVRILVNGRPLPYHNSQTLLAGDVLLSSTEDVVRTFAARLYFADEQGILWGEDRLLPLYEGETRGVVTVNALLAGPESPALQALLPADFTVLSTQTEEGVCYVNLPEADEELLPPEPESQELVIQSLVRSLCSLDGVEAVQILIDGEMRGTLGAVDISQALGGT